jgi:hypothetical protein
MPMISAAARKTTRPLNLLAAVSLCLLSGCVGLDAAERATLTPVGSTGFVYHATTDLFYGPSAYGWAEAQRLAWLPDFLHVYGLCPLGFTLTSRQVSFLYESPLGEPIDDIRYVGHCIFPPAVPAISQHDAAPRPERYGGRPTDMTGRVA